jgi:hypothetical protein
MPKLLNIGRKLRGDQMMNIEMILGSILQPVSPREEFVRSMQTKILASTFPEGVRSEKRTKKNILVLVLSLMGVTILLSVWVRMVISLLMLLGITLKTRHAPRKQRSLPVHSPA